MKKVAFLYMLMLATLTVFSQSVVEESENLKKPADCGVEKYDSFKNAAFTLKDDLLKSTKNHAQLSEDIAKYETGEKEKTAINIAGDAAKMKQLKSSLASFDEKVNSLATEGKDLAENVSSVKPITKVKQASGNTKTSMKAVDLSRDLLKELKTNVDKDIETLNKLKGE